MRNLSDLYLRRFGPALSRETIPAFEKHFQVTLPPSYLHFLSLANGGEPMLDCTFDYTTVFGKYKAASRSWWCRFASDWREFAGLFC